VDTPTMPAVTASCPVCGREREGGRTDAVYCSDACRQAAYRARCESGPPVSDAVRAKAAEYLTAGRLTVVRVRGDHVVAECRGGASYHVERADGRWSCSCPARRTCAHIAATMLVVEDAASPT